MGLVWQRIFYGDTSTLIYSAISKITLYNYHVPCPDKTIFDILKFLPGLFSFKISIEQKKKRVNIKSYSNFHTFRMYYFVFLSNILKIGADRLVQSVGNQAQTGSILKSLVLSNRPNWTYAVTIGRFTESVTVLKTVRFNVV